MELDFELESLY